MLMQLMTWINKLSRKKKREKNNESPSMFQNSSIFANNLVVNKNIAYSLQWVPHNLNLHSPL